MVEWVLIDTSLMDPSRFLVRHVILLKLIPLELDLILEKGDQGRLV